MIEKERRCRGLKGEHKMLEKEDKTFCLKSKQVKSRDEKKGRVRVKDGWNKTPIIRWL